MNYLRLPMGLSWLLCLFLWQSCDDLELIDTNRPSIEVKVPVWGDYLQAGEQVLFEATFTDDLELATYNIEIHENFTGHTHGRIAVTKDDPSLSKWSFKQSFTIPDGLILFQAVLDEEIGMPTNTMAGPYHFIVQAIDLAGNATNFQDGSAVELEIYITNDSQPIISITNIESGELDIEVDKLFIAEGNVTDPTTGAYAGMLSMDVILDEGLHDGHDHVHGGRIAEEGHEALIDVFYEEGELDQFIVDGAIVLGKVFEHLNFTLTQDQLNELITEEIDHLLLTIRVNDKQGNIAVSNTDVHVHMD